MNICKKCNSELSGNFCSNCGQAAKLKRIDKYYILHEIGSVINFEKGIFFTIKELLIRPGQSIREFIAKDRNRLIKPIIFIIVSSLIYTLITQLFYIEDGYISFDNSKKSAITFVFKWIQNNYGYTNIMMGIFIAFWIKLFFRRYDYNFFEILILLCFVMGIGMLIFAFFGILEGLTNMNLMQIAGLIGVLYCSWGIGQFFDKGKKVSYLKAFFAYILGMIAFTFSAIFLGLLIDLIVKH